MTRLLILVAASACFAQTDEVRNPRTSAADIAAGEKTFRSHCASCHGFKADGGRGPDLAHGALYRGESDADLLRNISDGIPGTEMPGLFYSPDRVWQVIAYLRSLRSAGAAAVKGDAQAGERTFRESGCQGCHRVNGEGGRNGPDLTGVARGRSQFHLVDSILNPGGYVSPRYFSVKAVAADGKASTGFLLNEDTYSAQILNAKGELLSVDKTALKSFEIDKASKMPSYRGKLTEAQVNDVVVYLMALARGAK